MIPLPRPYGILIVVGYAFLHSIWAGLLLYDSSASWATALAPIWHFYGDMSWLGLIVSATLAMISLFLRDRASRLILLIPQQFLAFLSAGGVMAAIYLGRYADGTFIPSIQIAADQIGYVVCALLHVVAMMQIAAKVR